MPHEWFRTPAWSPSDQEDFERRLARARSWNRAQYLNIKGLALRSAGHRDDAQALWQRGLDCAECELEKASILENMADAAQEDDPALAEALLRRLLSEYPELNGTTGMAQVALAELLIEASSESGLEEASQLLDAWWVNDESPFPANHFRFHVARVRWAVAVGDHVAARNSAREAVRQTGSLAPFASHPDVGLVATDPPELEWLESWVT